MNLNESVILVCDDSKLVRKKLVDYLGAQGCIVLEAANGQEGFDCYKEQKPNAVFMDIVMPVVDGLEALKMIRTYDPAAKVIMLSSTGTLAKLTQAIKDGAVDFIQKPYEEEQLLQTLARL